MGYRMFSDAEGVEWQAWDIVPRLAERRARERRLARLAVAHERRSAGERRLQLADRAVLSNGLHRGWLCFETALEKRRLAPIPADWLRCSIEQLRSYLAGAIPAARVAAIPPARALDATGTLDRRAG